MGWLPLLKFGCWMRHAGETLEIFALRRMPLSFKLEWFQVWEDRAASWGRIANYIQRGKPTTKEGA
jgi:hypothetical protein